MKKAYLSPKLDESMEFTDVVLASVAVSDLGDGDWGVKDEL